MERQLPMLGRFFTNRLYVLFTCIPSESLPTDFQSLDRPQTAALCALSGQMLLKKQDLKKMTKENWTIEIKPKKKWLDIDLKGIWRDRDPHYMQAKCDIVTVYKPTILGPFWVLIPPTFPTVMYIVILGGLAGNSTEGVPQLLSYIARIMRWT